MILNRFRVDESSPSGIRWKVESRGRNKRCFCGDPAGYLAYSGNENYGWRWCVCCKKPIPVSRVVWILLNGPIPDGMLVDHRNGNVLDNTIQNLCLKNHGHNVRCRTKLCSHNKSGFHGVGWKKSDGNWRARLQRNGVVVQKCFSSPEDAARQYDKWVIEWAKSCGEEARALNFPNG